jgi:hypothetical protein
MHLMARLEKLALCLVAAAFLTPGAVLAQTADAAPSTPSNVWTFCTDSSNNLVVQDLSSYATSPAAGMGQPFCLQYAAPCPSDSARIRRKYTVRGASGRGSEWRLDVAEPIYPQGGMTLPLTAGVTGDKGTVQVVSSPGPWTVDLTRIPAFELHAGEGKKWKVGLTLEKTESGAGCWLEVQCPARAQ